MLGCRRSIGNWKESRGKGKGKGKESRGKEKKESGVSVSGRKKMLKRFGGVG